MAGTAPAEGTLQTARVPVQCYREVFPAKSAAMHRHLRASVLDPKRASPRAWQDRLRDPSLTVLLVLQLFLLFVALPLAATGVPIAAPVAWLLLLVAVFRRRGRFVANADREQRSMMRTDMLAWLLHLHGRRLRQEPPPRRGAEGLQQIGRFEHSLIKRNRKFVYSSLEGDGFELSVPRYKTMLLDTADPLAGRAGRSLRETAPEMVVKYPGGSGAAPPSHDDRRRSRSRKRCCNA